MHDALQRCIERLEAQPGVHTGELLAQLYECRMLYCTEPLCADSAFPYERTTMLLFQLSRTGDALRADARCRDAELETVLEVHEQIDEILAGLLGPLRP